MRIRSQWKPVPLTSACSFFASSTSSTSFSRNTTKNRNRPGSTLSARLWNPTGHGSTAKCPLSNNTPSSIRPNERIVVEKKVRVPGDVCQLNLAGADVVGSDDVVIDEYHTHHGDGEREVSDPASEGASKEIGSAQSVDEMGEKEGSK